VDKVVAVRKKVSQVADVMHDNTRKALENLPTLDQINARAGAPSLLCPEPDQACVLCSVYQHHSRARATGAFGWRWMLGYH
jgi:hypothetical protein